MLFGSNLLEVAIGVMFVYLLLSLLCSAFSELIESFIRFRARDLKKGIGNLLGNTTLAKDLFNHSLIKPLGTRPSYIPARTFSLALWNLATTKAPGVEGAAAGVTQDLKAIRALIASLDESTYKSIKTSLLTLIDEAGNDIHKARTNIEGWYNDAMDRVSGWYKRRTHWILIVIGLLAALFLNVDTINVTRALWYNDTLRNSVVAAADVYIKANSAPPPAQGETGAKTDSASTAPADSKAQNSPDKQVKSALDKVNEIHDEINTLGLPIGWVFKPDREDKKYTENPKGQEQYERDMNAYPSDLRRVPVGFYNWFLKVLGILFTALAVSQGAPFWFDLLNKFMVIRSTIKPHEKSQDQPSKDKPAPETIKDPTEDKDKDN